MKLAGGWKSSGNATGNLQGIGWTEKAGEIVFEANFFTPDDGSSWAYQFAARSSSADESDPFDEVWCHANKLTTSGSLEMPQQGGNNVIAGEAELNLSGMAPAVAVTFFLEDDDHLVLKLKGSGGWRRCRGVDYIYLDRWCR
jgi:hypothetical protein